MLETPQLNATDTAITTFKLRTFRSTRNVDCWLKLAAKSRIKDLDLYFSTMFKLPLDVLRIGSLTGLRLTNVRMENSLQSFSLPSLVSLSLQCVSLEDQTLRDILSGCSALAKLVLESCKGLSVPRISSSSLKCLDIVISSDGETFHVEAKNLESLKCCGHGAFEPANLSLCGTLRALSFSSVSLNDEWLEDLIPRLPCLESLTINRCRLKRVKIRSQRLRGFTFIASGSRWPESEFTIDAPNLVHFSFEGYPTSEILLNNVPISLEARVRFLKKGM